MRWPAPKNMQVIMYPDHVRGRRLDQVEGPGYVARAFVP